VIFNGETEGNVGLLERGVGFSKSEQGEAYLTADLRWGMSEGEDLRKNLVHLATNPVKTGERVFHTSLDSKACLFIGEKN